MNELKDIWAKSQPEVESLPEHTIKVINIWSQLRERYYSEIKDDGFWNMSFHAVSFHDFGKICNIFQDTIKGKRAYNDDERVRHEFFSGMFLYLNDMKYYENNPESIIAVFSHHKAFNDGGFNEHISRNRTIKSVLQQNLIEEFVVLINKIANQKKLKGLKLEENTINFINSDYEKLLLIYRKKFYKELSKANYLNSENRRNYILHKAALNISDWTASGHLQLEKGIEYDKAFLTKKIISKLLDDGKNDIAQNFSFRDFQNESIEETNVIAIAPTGSGKTEAALLWASSKKDWERIIYLLPTRVTSNSIYTRLSDYFGDEYTQLIHSSARQYIKEQKDDSYDQKRYFRDKSFFKNINICTVDQILTLGFNLGFWEVKTFHMLNARVIIDEIHLYSPYTLGLIISTIEYLKENFNTKFYIMTATMPTKLQNLLGKTLGDFKLIKDKELLDKSRNVFEVKDCFIDEYLDVISSNIENGKKVLIVVNTVDKAIELFENLKVVAENSNKKAVCYHSRFIKKDRSKKEIEIFELDKKNDGGVLIATQVVEVSLDIDFDILFTENAPIDAIIQRAGRVNRKRKKKNSKVIILKNYEISEKIYDYGNVLLNTFEEFKKVSGKKLTERELNELVDIVYKDLDIQMNEKFIEGLNKHLDIQHKYNFIKDLTTDEKVFTREGLDAISVIPGCYYEDLADCKDKDKLSNHELSISKRRANSVKIFLGSLNFKFIDANYDNEKGLTFKKNDNKSFSY